MKNKAISILLCIALAVSLFSMTALAEENDIMEPVHDPKANDVCLPAFFLLCEAGEYKVNAVPSQNGTVTAVADGEGNVILTIAPEKGFTLETINVTDAEGSEVAVVNNENGTFTFVMPASDVTVTATFMEDNTMLNFCMDVTYRNWYYDDVLFVYENGIMNGTSPVEFSPKMNASRGMIATILYKLEGQPAFMNDNVFTDVSEGAYYEKAVVWANGKGVVKGYDDGTFQPNANITREQLAAILYRYAQYKGEGFKGAWMFPLRFDDAAQVSGYANEAMHWCVMNGIINGIGDNLLAPKANATRAEVAAMLHTFVEVMGDAMANQGEEEPEYEAPEFIDYTGTYEDAGFNTITFVPAEDHAYIAEIGVYRLTTFTGVADYMDGALEIEVEDPNGGVITATFYPTEVEGVYNIIVTTSTWALLPEGTVFSGFVLKTTE